MISPLNSTTINTPGGRRTNCRPIDPWKLSQSIHIWAHQRNRRLCLLHARGSLSVSGRYFSIVCIAWAMPPRDSCEQLHSTPPPFQAHLGSNLEDNESYAWPGGPDAPRGTAQITIGYISGIKLASQLQIFALNVLLGLAYSFIATRNNNSKHYTRSGSVLIPRMRSEI